MSHARAVARLRIVAKTVFKSLPSDARRILNGLCVQVGDIGCTPDGRRIEGLARKDGKLVVLDREFLEQGRECDHETALAHELAHILRTRTGLHDEDEQREEAAVRRQLKAWGWREKKRNRR